ncbi:DELLA protein RGL1 [Linum perenne]
MDNHASTPAKKRSWQEIFFQPTPFTDNDQDRTNQSLPLTSTTFHLLNHRSSSSFSHPTVKSTAAAGRQKPLSIEEAITLAATRIFRCSNSGQVGIPSLLNIQFDPSISSLSIDDQKNVELAEYLLSSADKVGNRQFNDASGWIDLCDCLSSPTGNPVQRIVHYFARALREKIEIETGRSGSLNDKSFNDLGDVLRLPSPSILLSVHERFPYYQMQQVASVQAMAESAARAKRIHGIDLQIKSGLHWIGLMQVVESRTDYPIERFRITALCTGSVEPVQATGDRLRDFAHSNGINFCFKVVMVGDVLDLTEEMFGVEEKEAVMVYSEHSFATMISQPDRMESFMRVMRRLDPRIMVVTEKEGNQNSPHFSTRFVETLFNYGAVFDSVYTCVGNDLDECRTYLESGIMGRMINNIVAREGDDRVIRGVSMNVWRTFFRRFEMVEKKLSSIVWQQVTLVQETAKNGEFCTTERDGKAMIVGWKGTPLFSVSTWKFFRSARLVSGTKHLRVEFE